MVHVATGDGLWVRHDVLAAARPVATSGGVEAAPHRAAHRTPAPRRTRPGPRRCGQCIAPRRARGKKTGPNPTDRRKAGSKHHVLTDAHGIPLVAILTAANRHDVTQLLPLVDAFPTLRGCAGRPATKPQLVQRRPRVRLAAPSRPTPAPRHRVASRQARPAARQWLGPDTLGGRAHAGLVASVPPPRRPVRAPALRPRSLPVPGLLARVLVLPHARSLISQRALCLDKDTSANPDS